MKWDTESQKCEQVGLQFSVRCLGWTSLRKRLWSDSEMLLNLGKEKQMEGMVSAHPWGGTVTALSQNIKDSIRGEERKWKTVWRWELKEKRFLEGVMFGVIMRHDGGRQRERMVRIPNGVKSGTCCFWVSLVWGWGGLAWLWTRGLGLLVSSWQLQDSLQAASQERWAHSSCEKGLRVSIWVEC